MVKQLGPGAASVTLKEMGTNCWLPRRFVEGGSLCDRVYTCSYPEKNKCQAVPAEIAYLKEKQARLAENITNIDHTIKMLTKMMSK